MTELEKAKELLRPGAIVPVDIPTTALLVNALRRALEQPASGIKQVIELYDSPEQPAQQEPVALETVYETIIQWDEGGGKRSRRELARRIVALYARPQAREPLTDEQIEREWQFLHDEEGNPPDHHDFARAIEAAHGIKENT